MTRIHVYGPFVGGFNLSAQTSDPDFGSCYKNSLQRVQELINFTKIGVVNQTALLIYTYKSSVIDVRWCHLLRRESELLRYDFISNMDSEFPVELLEHIFHKLDISSLRECRLVCRAWNQEIKSHVKLGLIVSDAKDGNLEFSKQVNLPVNLKIFELEVKNYEEFTTLKLNRVKALSIKYAYQSKPKINIRVFSDKCCMLTTLKLHRPVLATCDLQEECDPSIAPRSIFPQLRRLFIIHVDNYATFCDGQQVQWTSKNISFLLNSIQSEHVQALIVRINANFSDINSCVGRQPYRFEDRALPEFISRQFALDNMILDIPIYSPNQPAFTPTLKIYPCTLRGLDVRSQCGLDEILDGDRDDFIDHIELLESDEHFYDNISVANSSSQFWRAFLLAQTKLVNAYFTNLANFGTASLIDQLVQNNKASLKCLSVDAYVTGAIDVAALRESCLKKFHICNVVFHRVEQGGEGDCLLKNVAHFPPTLKSVSLLNITVDIDELAALTDIVTLRGFSFLYTLNHYKRLDDEDFGRFLEIVLFHRSLKKTTFGTVRHQAVAEYRLNRWYDVAGMKIRIP